jgi:hypothetical protein
MLHFKGRTDIRVRTTQPAAGRILYCFAVVVTLGVVLTGTAFASSPDATQANRSLVPPAPGPE